MFSILKFLPRKNIYLFLCTRNFKVMIIFFMSNKILTEILWKSHKEWKYVSVLEFSCGGAWPKKKKKKRKRIRGCYWVFKSPRVLACSLKLMKGSNSHHQNMYCLKINEGTALYVVFSTLIFFSSAYKLRKSLCSAFNVQFGVMPVKSMIKMNKYPR